MMETVDADMSGQVDLCEFIVFMEMMRKADEPGSTRSLAGMGRGTGAGSVNNVCGNTTDDGTVFIRNTPSVGYLDAGDQLYTDSSFLSKFNHPIFEEGFKKS